MRIDSIRIKNISSYSGEHFFDFELLDDKKIILIGGQNGTGKTSLFLALKLALYGHLCFNYQSANGHYFARIKELISHDAFVESEVRAFVEIEIKVLDERDCDRYKIKREWEYIDNRLSEILYVYQNEELLSESQKYYFENYLYTVLPPNLFDFYFFDGEQIADFFTTSNYNKHIKNAILTLFNFDTFEIIRKFCDGYISNSDISNGNSIVSAYNEVNNMIDSLKMKQISVEQQLLNVEKELTFVKINKTELENAYKKSGGLTESEREGLLKSSRTLENRKGELSTVIKDFVEGDMPFIIASSIVPEIVKQLEKEDEVKKHLALIDKIKSPSISKAVAQTLNSRNIFAEDNLVSDLTSAIINSVKPNVDIDNFSFIHDLSREQNERVFSVINTVRDFKAQDVINHITEREMATNRTISINKKLREALDDRDVAVFSSKLVELTNKEAELRKQWKLLVSEKENIQETIENLEKEHNKLYEKVREGAKNRNVYDLTRRISISLDSTIKKLTNSKFKLIETEILATLKKILRKDNFIDLVELDENFNIYIYKEQTYLITELENLIRNIGSDELEKRIGVKGTNKMLEEFCVDSISDLRTQLKKSSEQINLFDKKEITLYKRIELGQLSKGEKQIFILSLYYAIIKTSGKDIPFIIDTPYARIDTEHREQISKEYLPNISNQVIIFSTDEEITQPYYDILKPFIAKEYLLEYNEKQSKTEVSSGYFYRR